MRDVERFVAFRGLAWRLEFRGTNDIVIAIKAVGIGCEDGVLTGSVLGACAEQAEKQDAYKKNCFFHIE